MPWHKKAKRKKGQCLDCGSDPRPPHWPSLQGSRKGHGNPRTHTTRNTPKEDSGMKFSTQCQKMQIDLWKWTLKQTEVSVWVKAAMVLAKARTELRTLWGRHVACDRKTKMAWPQPSAHSSPGKNGPECLKRWQDSLGSSHDLNTETLERFLFVLFHNPYHFEQQKEHVASWFLLIIN